MPRSPTSSTGPLSGRPPPPTGCCRLPSAHRSGGPGRGLVRLAGRVGYYSFASNKLPGQEAIVATLEDVQERLVDLSDRAGAAVVGIGHRWALGSGVVVAPGRVLTNAHNLRREEV